MQNQNKPLVSIGIPTYNRPQQLRKTLTSITCQTYSNLEIIVSDNCSSDDETQEVVQEFMETDSRIRYFRQDENIGMFYNFKFVFDVSKGDYFTWVADDDARSIDYIENCLNIFDEKGTTSSLVLVNSYSQLVDPDTNQVIKVDKGCTTLGLNPRQRCLRYLSSIYTDQAAIGDLIYGLIKREPLQRAMAVQPNVLSWDHVFLNNLALQGEFYTIPRPLMSSGPGGISTVKDVNKMAKAQRITNPLYIKKARWITALSLCRSAVESRHLHLLDKVMLSAWILWSRFAASTANKLGFSAN
jgi:hypothetical protein